MEAHRIRVVVPDNHRAVVEFPASIRSGPVELIVLVPEGSQEENRKPEGQGRMAALAAELAKDPRPFHELSSEERAARIQKVIGVGRGLLSTNEEFTWQKLEETKIEDSKLGR